MDLSDRQQQLLKAIIETYVKSGDPVASEVIEKSYDLGVSPATIRNEMVKLTDLGYLKQPHTSAGRIPTSMGFRFYIAHLMNEKELPVVDEVTIRQNLLDHRAQFQRVVKEATRSLSKKCNTLAMSISDGEIFYTGAASILDFPEFDEVDTARFVLSLFDEPALLLQILNKSQTTDSLHIIFGEETDYASLLPTSFAFLTYNVGEVHEGVIGVIGPNRLNFPLIIPYLKYVGKVLTEAGQY
jgi:heat-inducible transcriptional repressor